jgi:hypothetical protein
MSAGVVLAVLLAYTYAFFFVLPYAGLYWEVGGLVTSLYQPPSKNSGLRLGDRILRIGDTSISDFDADLRLQVFAALAPGERVPIEIERQGQQLTIDWVFPGPNPREVQTRLLYIWWLPYLFWATGTFTLLALRPRATQRTSLVAFNFLTALWISGAGSPIRTSGDPSSSVQPATVRSGTTGPSSKPSVPRRGSHFPRSPMIIAAEWLRRLPLYSLAWLLVAAVVRSRRTATSPEQPARRGVD